MKRDVDAAVRHFERAADQGSAEGKYNVGVVALAGLDPQVKGLTLTSTEELNVILILKNICIHVYTVKNI